MNKSKKMSLIIVTIIILIITACVRDKNQDYLYQLKLIQVPDKWYTDEVSSIELEVINKGKIPWVMSPDNLTWRVRASYHILGPNGDLISEGLRSDFAETIYPGKKETIRLNVKVPDQPGKYLLRLDLLKEGSFWFVEKGNRPLIIEIDVEDSKQLNSELIIPVDEFSDFGRLVDEALKNNSSRFRMYSPYAALNETIKIIKRNYDKNYIADNNYVTGYAAGSNYPQVWLRDSYYHAASGMIFFPIERIKLSAESFLFKFAKTGKVPDFISTDGSTGSFSASADGPALMMLFACNYIDISGDYDWLKKEFKGKSIYRLLINLEDVIFKKYFNATTGLYFSSHTADWGDVEFEDKGDDALQYGKTSHKVAGIYHQSLYYAALMKWANILYRVNLYQSSYETRFAADALKQRTNDLLWQRNRWFYKIHHHIDVLKHKFDEDRIFALGGNIWAVKSGIADSSQVTKILSFISNAQERNNYPSISKVLIPSYPGDFFLHPALAEPDRYQNGGFWDWYGGLVVEQEFAHGQSKKALGHLLEISSLISRNRNLCEWYDKNEIPNGSMHYLSTGASVLNAVFNGYLGIVPNGSGWMIAPAFTGDEKAVVFNQDEKGVSIIYRYRNDTARKKIIIDYFLEGQDFFNWNIQLPVIDKDEFLKEFEEKDRNYYYNNTQKRLYYHIKTAPGRDKLEIKY